jgi:hypothetical protein
MNRFFIAGVLAIVASSPAFAQDMPLSQIVIDGEGWKKAENVGEKPKPQPGKRITHSPDRSTMFQALPIPVRYLHAGPRYEGGYGPFTPCAPLRTKRGEMTIAVTSLATDKDGRIYAATEMGVQVFDPTGRLCGVLTPAAPGKPEHLAFEGDLLTHWIGETKYARKLNTQGAK